MGGLEAEPGIDKTIRKRPVFLSFIGLDADEHDPTFHGGVDKAVHGCIVSAPRICIYLIWLKLE